ncbi:hypothetical protein B0H11DRAFT_1903759 [Mycena galericulata]|nr:hypothetical protein B0H11DRAFT_1903759 [Mycena galericulata]
MSDPTLCRGKDSDGNQCICMRSTETVIDDDGKVLCKNCGHIESAHPEARLNTGTLIRSFRDAGKRGSSLPSGPGNSIKASEEEAVAETSAGLHGKRRKSNTDTEPPTAKRSKTSVDKDKPKKPTASEIVKYGKLVLLTPGITHGHLRNPKLPSVPELDQMRSGGLVVLSTPEQPLFIDTAWSCERVNKEIKKLCHKPIGWLERQPYQGDAKDSLEIRKQLWLGVIKHGKNLTVASDPFPTGVELAHYAKGRLGTARNDRVLYLASKHKISQERYLDWDASDVGPESEDLGSDIESVASEDIITSKPGKTAKGKAKTKQEIDVKEEPADDSDMKMAAKMRTRLSTGKLQYKKVVVPGSSDGPEPEAGPSGTEVLIVSDDDTEFPPAPTLPTTPSLSAIANAWNPPLHIKSPSPGLFIDSPEQDPPSFFDDFEFGPEQEYTGMTSGPSSSSLPVQSSSGMASSSSLPAQSLSATSISSSGPFPFAPVSIPGALPSFSSPAASGSTIETAAEGDSSAQGVSQPRFTGRRMGKGREGRNPWV